VSPQRPKLNLLRPTTPATTGPTGTPARSRHPAGFSAAATCIAAVQLGILKAWCPLTLEIASSVTFDTKNDDFLNGMTREQDPLYAAQGHQVYSIGYGIWAALDSTYYMGGRTKVNGIANENWLWAMIEFGG
jgi:hypothetical protein